MAKKKTFENKEPVSHKEVFNWDNNVKEEYKKQVYDIKKQVPAVKQRVNDDKSKKNKSSFKFNGGVVYFNEKVEDKKFTYQFTSTESNFTRPHFKKRDPGIRNPQEILFTNSKFQKTKSAVSLFKESADFTLKTSR